MRTLLVINPRSTGASRATQRVVERALSSELDLEVVETDSRGHGVRLSSSLEAELVIACGGDGTVNEVCNGLIDFTSGKSRGAALGIIPTGSTNVFARALGFRNDPVEATHQLLESIKHQNRSEISLGLASWESPVGAEERIFTFCAGIGFDAAIVERVDRERLRGNRSSASLYWRATSREVSRTLLVEEHAPLLFVEEGLRLGVALVSNTDPYTYMGHQAIHPSPRAGFATGLDLMGLKDIRIPNLVPAMFTLSLGQTPRKGIARHDLTQITLRADRALPIQLDGEPLGRSKELKLRSLPAAVTVYGGKRS
ncbi:MAG: diacylglycerol kinase family protein [Actinomycetes bacterium]